jgi:hypothetical protein
MEQQQLQLLATGGGMIIADAVLAVAQTGSLGMVIGVAATAMVAHHIVKTGIAGREQSLPAMPVLTTPQQPEWKRQLRKLTIAKAARTASTSQPASDDTTNDIVVTLPQQSDQDAQPDCLHLGCTLRPHASQILSKRIGVFGIPGSGKTNGLTVFLEELGKLPVYDEQLQQWVAVGVPFVLADTEGEYESLHNTKYLTRPYKAGAHNVTQENAFQFGQSVLERGRQVILNLQSYESDDQAAFVMIEIIAGMRAWAEERENDERATCMFILDEASIWLPQRQEESVLSKQKPEGGTTLLARLQQAFFGTVVRRGRKRGIGFLFATQRPADLDKRCISCDWLILFRQTFPNDLAKYAELGVPKDVAQALAPGEAFVIDPHGTKTVQQFRERHSPDNSRSPGVASLQKHAQRWATAIDAIDAIEPASQDDQAARQPERQAAAQVSPTLLERAMLAYDEGAITGPKLAAALEISLWEVRAVMEKVKLETARREKEAK